MTICPKCQYRRTAGETAPDWQCPACGVAYGKALRDGAPPVPPEPATWARQAALGVLDMEADPSPQSAPGSMGTMLMAAIVVVWAAFFAAWVLKSGGVFDQYGAIIVAIGGPVVVYILAKWLVLPRMRSLAEDVVPRQVMTDLHQSLPPPFAWITRVLIYGAICLIVGPMVLRLIAFRPPTGGDECDMRNRATCIDKKTGLIKSIPALESAAPGGVAKPEIPCRFVGVWASGQNGQMRYTTTLSDDGTYSMEPGPGVPGGAMGLWMVQGNSMVWRHQSGGGANINPIRIDTITKFTLTERNGSRTEFNLVEPIKSATCAP
jgi:hypothetical protein